MRALAALLVLVVAAGAARADAREAARREFAAGQAADKRRDWQGAIEHYLRANDLAPHPFAMFNVAVNYERLDNLREATTWYERYLAATTDAAERERVQRKLIELAQRPAPLVVRTTPPGAQLAIDAVPIGTTPYTGTLARGFHRITVNLRGQRAQRDVTVEYGEPVTVELALRGAATTTGSPAAGSGRLRVTGTPAGAAIAIDGEPAGQVPAELAIAPGGHAVAVTAEGYTPDIQHVYITADRETVVDARLRAGRRVVRAGYLIGFAGGTDIRGSGPIALFELGIRIARFDASARLGKAGELTAVDLLARFTLTSARTAPFVGAAYTAVSEGGGFALIGGVRFDFLRREHVTVSLLGESGVRYYSGQKETIPGGTPKDASGLIVPFMASLLVLYK